MSARVQKHRRPSRPSLDEVLDGQERRQAGARRTAWIIGAIALAFFIASLVEGHFVQIMH